jgi:branched-chain amino acid transport system ATP-binding protein
LAARVMVMHQGRPLADGAPAEIRCDPQVRRAYLGSFATHANA